MNASGINDSLSPSPLAFFFRSARTKETIRPVGRRYMRHARPRRQTPTSRVRRSSRDERRRFVMTFFFSPSAFPRRTNHPRINYTRKRVRVCVQTIRSNGCSRADGSGRLDDEDDGAYVRVRNQIPSDSLTTPNVLNDFSVSLFIHFFDDLLVTF